MSNKKDNYQENTKVVRLVSHAYSNEMQILKKPTTQHLSC